MKPRSTTRRLLAPLAVSTLLAGSTCLLQAVPDRTLNTFDAAASGWGTAWGNASAVFDPTQDNSGNGGGSVYISGDYAVDQNTMTIFGVEPPNGAWYFPGPSFNMSEYASVEFDIKWDTSKTVGIGDFNANPGGDGGIQIWNVDSPGFTVRPVMGTVLVPEGASNGWVHVSMPINPITPNLDPSVGIVLKKWITSTTQAGGGTYGFWVDNLVLKGTDGPPPPPEMSLEDTTPGLQLVTTSAGGQYGRQSIYTVDPNYSWVGASGPVTYEITIKEFPSSAYPGFQTHVFLSTADNLPYGPGDSSLDWNSTNLIFIQIQNIADGGGQARFMFKTNVTSSSDRWEGQIFGSNTLAEINATTPLGTWSFTFANDTNITITTPDNTTTNFILQPDAAAYFTGPLHVWFGSQPNAEANIGQASVVERIRIFGGGVSPEIDDSFPGPGLSPTWAKAAVDASAVQVASDGTIFWLKWTLPDNGFSPQWSPVIGNGENWTDPGLGAPIQVGPIKKVAVPASLSSDNAFFRLIKREFVKLQVLMPGETADPGTPTGKVGTPIVQQVNVPFFVTVRAVDSEYNLISGINHTVTFTSTDGTAFVPPDGPLVNGVGTFEMVFGSTGSWTVTASDVTDNTKLPGTGAATTVE